MWTLIMLFFWPVRRVVRWARHKGFWYFVAWAACTSIDSMVPELGGKLTTAAIVLAPPLMLSLYLHLARQWAGSASDYFLAAFCMLGSSAYGLLRAWSDASGIEIPGWQQKLGLVIFGLPLSILAGIASTVTGHEFTGPMPLVHPDGVEAQIRALNPLLTLASLAAGGIAVWQLRFALIEYGGGAPAIPAELRIEARNRVMPDFRAARLLGGAGYRWRQIWGLLLPSARQLRHDEMVVAAALPSRDKPWRYPLLWLGRLLAGIGFRLELTRLDPTPLIVAKCETSAIYVGGAGAGKTHGWYLMYMATRNAPIVLFDVQGNAGSRDAPLRRALGRRPFIFDARLGMESASTNVLGFLDPHAGTFFNDVDVVGRSLITDAPDGAHADLRGRSRTILSIITGNHVTECAFLEEEPSLAEVYSQLMSADLAERLALLGEHGHPAWRDQALKFAEDFQKDDEIVGSLQFFLGEAMKWLGDPVMAAIVSGQTRCVADPHDVIDDAGRVDWLMQPTSDEMKSRPGAWRLLINAVVHPHAMREEEECEGKPKTLLLVDEGPALGRFELINDAFVRHRQKGVMIALLVQSAQQMDDIFGAGQMRTWEETAMVQGFARITKPELAEKVEALFGQRLILRYDRQTAPGGGLGGNVKRWEPGPLVSKDRLMNGPKGQCAVIVENHLGRSVLLSQMPFAFRHPFMRARIRRAKRRYPSAQIRNGHHRLALEHDGSQPRLLADNRLAAATEQDEPDEDVAWDEPDASPQDGDPQEPPSPEQGGKKAA